MRDTSYLTASPTVHPAFAVSLVPPSGHVSLLSQLIAIYPFFQDTPRALEASTDRVHRDLLFGTPLAQPSVALAMTDQAYLGGVSSL